MILDDEDGIRQALLDFLEDFEEFDLRSAVTAEDALEQLQSKPADLSVVDMRLPHMNGLEFIRAAQNRNLCTHFLLHTGSIDMDLSSELDELGLSTQDLFQKPCPNDQILNRIRELL